MFEKKGKLIMKGKSAFKAYLKKKDNEFSD